MTNDEIAVALDEAMEKLDEVYELIGELLASLEPA